MYALFVQLSVEARASHDALLTEFVQLYVQLRQVDRLIQRLFMSILSSEGKRIYFPDGFCTRLVLLSVSLPAALRAAQICRYLVYSEADFEVRHVAPMGVKFGMEEGTEGPLLHAKGRSPPPCQISPPSVQRQGCRTPKIEIFTQI